ncbi:MAG TPA: 50S ribosomal protein L25 [Planctomycetaceae bacterium]|nr:50S ribosomal protein L25 [Planctomycetaceae bacterium]
MTTEVLHCEARQELGTRATRRLRRKGMVPANLYGHGQANVNLAVPVDDVEAAIRHGAHMVQLQGAVNDTAFIREVQWNTFGNEVLHLDLTRVSAKEKVEVDLSIELRGEAPGAKEGGEVSVMTHEVTIVCPAEAIPEKIEVNVNDLHVGTVIHASDLELPEGAELVTPPDTPIVGCQARAEVAEEAEEAPAAADLSAEPEVIGRSKEEESEEE